MPAESYPVRWSGSAVIVKMPTEIDISNSGAVEAALTAALALGARSMLVDMTATGFCDCSGVGALVRTFARATALGSTFGLVVATAPVRRILAVTSTDQFITVHPDLTAAQAGEPSASC